jgi:hypothetical protein
MEGVRVPADLGGARSHAGASGHEGQCGAQERVEDWLRAVLEAEGVAHGAMLARQIILLMDGSFAVVLLHRDPTYMETAGEAAASLIRTAEGRRS